MNVRFLRAADAEVDEAVAYYGAISETLGDRFKSELEATIMRLVKYQLALQQFDGNHRRLLMKTFPFGIIYRLEGADVLVVALAHNSRRQGYWKGRV